MATGGALKKLTLGGSPFDLSSDADLGIDPGGRRITDKQDTTGFPVFIVDKVGGYVEGVAVRVFGSDGSLALMQTLIKDCANGTDTSCLIQLADGTKFTPKGGAKVRTEDGKMMTREGTYAITIDAVQGEWIQG